VHFDQDSIVTRIHNAIVGFDSYCFNTIAAKTAQMGHKQSCLTSPDKGRHLPKSRCSMTNVPHERKPTILLVEDSPDEEMLVMRSVKQSDTPCQMLVAHTTDEALDYLFRRGSFAGRESTSPDVVITDLKIRSIGGAELTSEIRRHPETHLLPIVVLTSAASEEQVRDLYERGANSFLEKPIDFDEFSAFVMRIARYWGALNTAVSGSRFASFPYPL
jgi:two-component system, response regulator